MRNLKKAVGPIILAVAGALASGGFAQAAESCHKINAKGIGQNNGDFTTDATIIGGGLLNGTTHASFTLTGFSPPIASFTGSIVVMTHTGSLTTSVNGTLDIVTGEFITAGGVIGGTGKLAGATGTLVFQGDQDVTTGQFTEQVTGVVCVDLAP
jgi:hypothetical protein